ncbi:MAG: hypothetical protein WA584_07860 [Pyrinomonadaceae bacterium]
MAQTIIKKLSGQSVAKLPPVVHQLIEKNRQRRIEVVKTSGNFRGRLDETTAYLRWKASNNTLSDAIWYIASELDRERLYALYRQLFPKEWRKSSASYKKTGFNEYHTEREIEFIELVSRNYFPLETWLDWSDFRFDHIPIEPINMDLCCGEFEWEEFRPCLRFAIAAFLWRGGLYDMDWGEILSSFNVEIEDLPPIERDTPLYAELEKQRDHPKIKRFLHLIEFIYHDTGNPFIDTTCCQPVELFEWTVEDLEKLKADYNGVAQYFADMDSIDASIERNALATFKELISLWNTGRLPKVKRRIETTDKSDDERGLLINILAETQAEEFALTF